MVTDREKELHRIRSTRYRKRHPDRVKKTGADFYKRNKIRLNKRSVENIMSKYWSDPDAARAESRKKAEQYRKKNRKKLAQKARDRYWENPQRFKQYMKDRRAKDPQRVRLLDNARGRSREAIKRAKTVGDKRAIAKYYRFVYSAERISCALCSLDIPKKLRSIDHVIPLSRGGPHSLENLQPAHISCNQKKYTSF